MMRVYTEIEEQTRALVRMIQCAELGQHAVEYQELSARYYRAARLLQQSGSITAACRMQDAGAGLAAASRAYYRTASELAS